jgi:hypothetical protein
MARTYSDDIQQLAPYLQRVEPLIQALDGPVTQLAIAGLPFVSVGVKLLKLALDLAKVEPTLESAVAIVAQLAYLKSLETVLARQDAAVTAKLGQNFLQGGGGAATEEGWTRRNSPPLTRSGSRRSFANRCWRSSLGRR